MKTTNLGTFLETFLGQFRLWAEKYNIPYFTAGFEPLEEERSMNYLIEFNNHQVFKDATSTALYIVQNNILGYGNFLLIARNNGNDLLAVIIEDYSNTLKSTISSIEMFNGVPIKQIVEEESACLVVFDY